MSLRYNTKEHMIYNIEWSLNRALVKVCLLFVFSSNINQRCILGKSGLWKANLDPIIESGMGSVVKTRGPN